MAQLLKIGICEDNEQDMDSLVECIKDSKTNVDIQTFSCAEPLINSFIPGTFDLIFFDIYTGAMLGVEAATRIREIDKTVIIAFTTTSTEHTLQSYRVKALAYIEKPVTKQEVLDVLLLALAKKNSSSYISLMSGGKEKKIPVENIHFVEQKNHAVNVYKTDGILRTSQSVKLDEIEPLLSNSFIRCHNSYIVNLAYVKQIDCDLAVFIMENNERVHIRQKDLKKSKQAFENYLFNLSREVSSD